MTAQQIADPSIPPLDVSSKAREGAPAPSLAENSDIDYSTPAIIPEDDALSRLDWHMRMVRKYRAERAELDAVYAAEMERIGDRWQNRQRIIEQKANWHAAPIESYHLAHPEKRTIELPHGTSKVRVAKSPQVFMPGESSKEVTEWARTAHPEIMRGPNVSDVRRVVEIVTHDDGSLSVIDPATGEVVPGVHAAWPLPSWSLDVEDGSPF